MRASSDKQSGRGGLTLRVSALGLALVVGGGVASARSAPVMEPTELPMVDRVLVQDRDPLPSYAAGPHAEIDRQKSMAPQVHPAKGAPQRIVVRALGIDAPVVGIDAPGGVLTPPDDPQVLGWWQSGAEPGAKRGSALITGHTVSSGGGAFDDLETLRRGARVTIGTAKGRIGYRVTGVTIYRKASLAKHAARVFSQEVPGRLVLITCEDWNGTTYLSNAVVTAAPVR